ncbi:hypothetical protein QVD17_36232 [Tagetes erecta]|uniref:Uncharacterized protein n=1 Tax=Tagetes erecta TaxID=13708 RepID=A0AAD8JTQ7_TARER|nr:hypothetical protein QVD17_36232 [Tagetes erecta]
MLFLMLKSKELMASNENNRHQALSLDMFNNEKPSRNGGMVVVFDRQGNEGKIAIRAKLVWVKWLTVKAKHKTITGRYKHPHGGASLSPPASPPRTEYVFMDYASFWH